MLPPSQQRAENLRLHELHTLPTAQVSLSSLDALECCFATSPGSTGTSSGCLAWREVSIVMIARVLNGTQCLIPAAMLRIGYAKTYLHFVVELKKLCALVAAGERS